MEGKEFILSCGYMPIYRFKNLMVSLECREYVKKEIAECIKQGFVLLPYEVELIGFISKGPGKEVRDGTN
jgi:hypothetical protein